MAGRTPAEAFKGFRELIQEAIACFAHTGVTGTSREPNKPGILTVNRSQPLPLKSTGPQVDITCSISYEIRQASDPVDGLWRVSTLSYIHTVTLDEELAVEFHWHPDDGSNVWYPHIHPRLAGSGRDRGGMHIPSGRVLIEDVLIFAHERGAMPLKDDWEGIVSRIKQRIAHEATWGAPSSLIHRSQSDN